MSTTDKVPTVEYIRYKIASEKRQAFLDAYTKAQEPLQQSPVCLGWELTHCTEDPEFFVLRIEWTSTDDHLNGFRKSSEFQTFFGYIKDFIPDIQEMRHYERTAVVHKK